MPQCLASFSYFFLSVLKGLNYNSTWLQTDVFVTVDFSSKYAKMPQLHQILDQMYPTPGVIFVRFIVLNGSWSEVDITFLSFCQFSNVKLNVTWHTRLSVPNN